MFGKGKNQMEAGITLIANNCEMAGDVHFSDQLLINGVIKGNIYAREGSKATVTVSEKGQVKGDIRVPNVIVNGKVDGDIYSSKHVELAARAEVKGNVYYNLIEMVMGSAVDGNLVHVDESEQDAPRSDKTAGSLSTQEHKQDQAHEQVREAGQMSAGDQVAPVKSKTG